MGPHVLGLDAFDVSAGTVYAELMARGFDTPQAVTDRLLTDGWRDRARETIREYNSWCSREGLTVANVMRTGTADELLALLLPDFAESIRDAYGSPGRGGRKPRQAIIASRYVRMRNEAATDTPADGAEDTAGSAVCE